MKWFSMMACAVLGMIAGCRSAPSGIDPAYQVTDSRLLGEWAGPSGSEFEISYSGGNGFRMEVSDATSKGTYRGHLLDIGGKRFAEVSLYQPDRSDQVPVYLYAVVEVSGDTMVHRPLRPEWLSQESKKMAGAIYKSTSEEQAGSGGVVVRDRAAMLELLKKAAGDPNAFGPGETLKRIHGGE